MFKEFILFGLNIIFILKRALVFAPKEKKKERNKFWLSAIKTASKIRIFMNSKSKDCCSHQIRNCISKGFIECKSNVKYYTKNIQYVQYTHTRTYNKSIGLYVYLYLIWGWEINLCTS